MKLTNALARWMIPCLTMGLLACPSPSHMTRPYEVPAAIDLYVQRFIQEAAERGRNIDFSDTGLKISLGKTKEGTSGICVDFGNAHGGPHEIVLDAESWERKNDWQKERLVFHELGHCELARPHRNDKFADSTWKSIMRGSPLRNDELDIPRPYFGFRKQYYIDELFDYTTPEPTWVGKQFAYEDLRIDRKVLQEEILEASTLDLALDSIPNEYQIDIIVSSSEGDKNILLQWGAEKGYYLQLNASKRIEIGIYESKLSPLYLRFESDLRLAKANKISIRQSDDFCQIFVNDQFEFFLDPIPFAFRQLSLRSDSELQIETFQLFEIIP